MADISKINGVPIANIEKLDAVLAANIAKVNGLVFSIAPAFTGLLDTYTGAAAGYSTRRLASSATVLMRVRRETAGGTGDDDEADVAYDSNNELSLDSAISNASAGVTATTLGQFLNVGTVNGTTYTNPDSLTVTASCFVDEWKDQSGNAKHAEQTAQGNQPQIHSGTVNTDLITENGKPGVEFTSYDNLTFTSTDIYSFFIVSRPTSINTGSANFAVGLSTSLKGIAVAGDSGSRQARAFSNTGTLNITGIGVSNNQSLVDYVTTGTNGKLRYNAANEVTGSATEITVDQLGSSESQNFRVLNGPLQEIVMYPTDQDAAGNRTGIEENINTNYLIYQPTDAPTSGLLATYTGAAAAYSVRQLSDKAVIALRIRRDSDDEEINIGFDANGDLDTTAISDFCSTANGYVTRWWDQSTNGNHADQATDANQPQIYNGTAVITEGTNSKAAIQFNRTSSNKLIMNSEESIQFFTHSMVYNQAKNDRLNFMSTSSAGDYYRLETNGGMFFVKANDFDYQAGDIGLYGYALRILIRDTSSTATAYVDASSSNSWTTLDASNMRFRNIDGQYVTVAAGYTVTHQEFIVWSDAKNSTDRAGIETSTNSYFGIY